MSGPLPYYCRKSEWGGKDWLWLLLLFAAIKILFGPPDHATGQPTPVPTRHFYYEGDNYEEPGWLGQDLGPIGVPWG